MAVQTNARRGEAQCKVGFELAGVRIWTTCRVVRGRIASRLKHAVLSPNRPSSLIRVTPRLWAELIVTRCFESRSAPLLPLEQIPAAANLMKPTSNLQP